MDSEKSNALDELIPLLKGVGVAGWREIQAETGVPLGTIRKIVYRETKNPRIDTVEPLIRWFAMRAIRQNEPVSRQATPVQEANCDVGSTLDLFPDEPGAVRKTIEDLTLPLFDELPFGRKAST